jgi:hypothetical protein
MGTTETGHGNILIGRHIPGTGKIYIDGLEASIIFSWHADELHEMRLL